MLVKEHEKQQSMTNLESLLQYELNCAKRYRRFLSIIMTGAVGIHTEMKEVWKTDEIRESDQFFDLEEGTAILMPETDGAGAITAINRCLEVLGPDYDLRFGVASFPFDAQSTEDLLRIAERRLQTAQKMPSRGTVIKNG